MSELWTSTERWAYEADQAVVRCWNCHGFGHRGYECPNLVLREIEDPGKFPVVRPAVSSRLLCCFWAIYGLVLGIVGTKLWEGFR